MDSKNHYAISQIAGFYDDDSEQAMTKRNYQNTLFSNISELMGLGDNHNYSTIQEQAPFLHYIFQVIALRENISISRLINVSYAEQDKYISRIVAMQLGNKKESSQALRASEVRVNNEDISTEHLQSFLEKFYTKLNTISVADWIASEYKKLKQLHLDAAMPDPAEMDRLMRYSTSINNQLSKAIGELLHIIKERELSEQNIDKQ